MAKATRLLTDGDVLDQQALKPGAFRIGYTRLSRELRGSHTPPRNPSTNPRRSSGRLRGALGTAASRAERTGC
jgi:hypothetical protein